MFIKIWVQNDSTKLTKWLSHSPRETSCEYGSEEAFFLGSSILRCPWGHNILFHSSWHPQTQSWASYWAAFVSPLWQEMDRHEETQAGTRGGIFHVFLNRQAPTHWTILICLGRTICWWRCKRRWRSTLQAPPQHCSWSYSLFLFQFPIQWIIKPLIPRLLDLVTHSLGSL